MDSQTTKQGAKSMNNVDLVYSNKKPVLNQDGTINFVASEYYLVADESNKTQYISAVKFAQKRNAPLYVSKVSKSGIFISYKRVN
jgi:hypothetical protein